MKIIADENIPLVSHFFGALGAITLLPAASIVPKVVKDADILLVRSVTKVNKALLEGSKVRFVGTATTGIDHIDTHYLAAQEITFASAHGANAESVVEYVLAALFHLGEKYQQSVFEKTVGIVGCGCVGGELVKRLNRLGIKVLQNDPIRHQNELENRCFVDLETLVRLSDVISLHVPLNQSTKYMIAKPQFEQMQEGAWFIHTCRGGVVKELDLKQYYAKLGGLVIDVWENEPNIDADLAALCDIATPHIAGYSYDGKIKGTERLAEAVCKYLGIPYNNPSLASKFKGVSELKNLSIKDIISSFYPILKDNFSKEHISPIQFVRYRKEYPNRFSFSAFQF